MRIPLIKIILIVFLLLCLLDMPYGYYQLVRFVALIGFGILAYLASDKGHKVEMIIYGVLALLFQPLFKIALGREIWNVVDLVVALGLIINLFIDRSKQANE